MKHLAISIFLLLLLLNCDNKQKEPVIPAHILSVDTFAKVLADFSLAESAANLNIKAVSQAQMDSTYAFNPLKENGIRQTQFDSSLEFYCHHGELYKKVYEEVLAKLTAFETQKNVQKDSIKIK
jgi:Domain of unknown function (DUF4296)